jgi:hypothetical protein
LTLAAKKAAEAGKLKLTSASAQKDKIKPKVNKPLSLLIVLPPLLNFY